MFDDDLMNEDIEYLAFTNEPRDKRGRKPGDWFYNNTPERSLPMKLWWEILLVTSFVWLCVSAPFAFVLMLIPPVGLVAAMISGYPFYWVLGRKRGLTS